MKRVKWEPAAALVLVILLGMWLALGPGTLQTLPTRPNAITHPIRVGESRGVLEANPTPDGAFIFRVLTRDGHVSDDLDSDQIRSMFGAGVLAKVSEGRPNRLFRLLNITTWTSMVWIGIGLVGQVAFSSRFLIQWIVSEKSRKTVVPESFWWMSLIGGIALFSYFAWRQDPIGVLGQSSGLVIYARNIRLLYKQRRREARAAAATADGGGA